MITKNTTVWGPRAGIICFYELNENANRLRRKSADPSGRRRVRAAAPNLCTLILQNPGSTLSAQNA